LNIVLSGIEVVIIKLKNLDDIKKELIPFGYFIIDKIYLGNKHKYNFIDAYGYKYLSYIPNIIKGSKPRIASVHNPFTLENIHIWCKLNNKKIKLLSKEFTGVTEKLEWKCLNKDCDGIFDSEWHVIFTNGSGCPYCAGQKVNINNCLATNCPDISEEWHPTKNGTLTPFDITRGTTKKAWWLCKNNQNHEWETKIQNRTINKTGCPYCSGRFASEDYNITVTHSELMKEWNYKRNDVIPTNYTYGSRLKVWWICEKGHEWEAAIANRTNLNRGCPYCNESKGEKKIREWLNNNNIKYQSQKEYDGLIGLGGGNLSYDFYLPTKNILIEYQGEFHDGSSGAYSRINLSTQKEHDKRKRDYAKQNNIELLEIWYYDFDNIEEILENKWI
jgi:hypothetical protein